MFNKHSDVQLCHFFLSQGIVVEVPLAFFFLGQLVKQVHSAIYSSLDELNSMDHDLNKSLHFVKVWVYWSHESFSNKIKCNKPMYVCDIMILDFIHYKRNNLVHFYSQC